jgi:hypothetical protein
MEHWRKVWREGIGPQMPRNGLEALRMALLRDEDSLIQHATTAPPAVDVFADEMVEAACAIGYCGWKGEGLSTVAEVSEFFSRACFAADEALGEPAVCRHFLNWFDETPRSEVRRLLLAEVNCLLNQGQAAAA